MIRAVNKFVTSNKFVAKLQQQICCVNCKGVLFMEFRDYIEAGAVKCGSTNDLAKLLEQNPAAIRSAKANMRGLPVYACIKLAELVDADPMEVIAASELVTEKKEDRIAVFRPFVQAARHAQHLTIAGFAVMTAFSLAVEKFSSASQSFLL
jgi:hypothetical protein